MADEKKVRTRFAVVHRSQTANTAARHAKVPAIPLNLIAIADIRCSGNF